MDRYIGKMLDNRYEILECIGTGGMADVYKARCHRLNRLVAVKILKPELARDTDFRRRFHDESQAVAMLSHANIVAVYDVSRSDELDYIVMELMDGMTLKQYMKKRGTPLNWREALHFITQIIRALGHAHSRGIIHRDIKPQNILVLRDGSAKVADFGIARLASAAHSTLTQEALGSVHYISPEQAKGSHIDGRSDLYSAGVVLYEMLTGRLPFEGETPVSVAIQHINSIPIPPRDLNGDIPKTLESITLKAMSPKVENRYGSAEEMLADLEEFRKNPDASIVCLPKSEEELMDEPTRVVPTAEIQKEERKVAIAQENRQKQRDDTEGEEVRQRSWGFLPAAIAITMLLMFVGGIALFLYHIFFKGLLQAPQAFQVPYVVGSQISALTEAQLGPFLIVEVGSEISNEYEQGEIIRQEPMADSTVMEGGDFTIQVIVSEGEEILYMPPVDNWYHRKATDVLHGEMGMKVNIEYEYNNDVLANYIISYAPARGTPLSRGDTVTLVVSQGKAVETVDVIPYLDMDIKRAVNAAESVGLKVEEPVGFYNEEYAEGKVIFQSIPSGTSVEKGTSITFQYSLGPEPAEPSVPPEISAPGPDHTMAGLSTKTITVDPSQYGYSGRVELRIMVEQVVLHDGPVDTSAGIVSKQASGSGVQQVQIFVNGMMVDSYPINFSS